ncbi:antitoxin Xre/MbcA/ParS toxin-binding domain-containing protein [Thiohalomonas denitrificans]|uniref:antitoxin Xre/MbcA/ParS toxin-binding domain-containing protein n=1 Tax=Thiohalomonas denitrificans TaxID=415747 RepID=UPI0026EC68A5|nr:antitoxin Xre/MbcA/ParS toxin-binding domain-containing protein [Thiohalomonas denitrificans]
MARTFLPELQSEESRRAVAEASVALLDRWGLDEGQEKLLLGIDAIRPYREGEPLPDNLDVLARAGQLLAIDRALKKRYADDPMMRDNWVKFPNPALGDFTPLLVMLGGPDGLVRVRDVAESPPGSTETGG